MDPTFEALAKMLEADDLGESLKAADAAALLRDRKTRAKQLIDGYRAEVTAGDGHGRSEWAIFEHEELDALIELRRLVVAPCSIDQADFGYCAAAATLAVLLTYFPNAMARFCRDLLRTGAGDIGALRVPATPEMLAVSAADVAGAVFVDASREPQVPDRLAWALLAVVNYAMKPVEENLDGLGPGGATTVEVSAFMKSTGLFDNFVEYIAGRGSFDLDREELTKKKDHPLREVFVGCDGKFLNGDGSRLPTLFANHVFWLIAYERKAPDVIVTYYTWGHKEERKNYKGVDFSRNCSDLLCFDVEITAGD